MKLGLLGKVLGHSMSPEIHESLFRQEGCQSTYELLEVPEAELEERLPRMLADYDGLNVTIPYKVAVIPFLDELSPEAKTIGAVNTIARKNGCLTGYNTDYTGFKWTLARIHCDMKGRSAVVLGHGGASRAIIQCLADEGAQDIAVISRHPDYIDSEFEAFARARHAVIRGYDWVPSAPNPWLLVNATPVGMYPHMGVSPVPAEITARFPKVVDIIYNPAETQLLKDARGDRINGMYMLVMQAVAAEEIWMDRDISEDTVQAIVKEMMS